MRPQLALPAIQPILEEPLTPQQSYAAAAAAAGGIPVTAPIIRGTHLKPMLPAPTMKGKIGWPAITVGRKDLKGW